VATLGLDGVLATMDLAEPLGSVRGLSADFLPPVSDFYWLG
jgi:hypothetical protein